MQGNCCPASRLNTWKRQFSAAKYHPHFFATSRAMKSLTDEWIALEDEDEEEGEGEDVMRALVEEEVDEDDSTDVESEGEEVGAVYELY